MGNTISIKKHDLSVGVVMLYGLNHNLVIKK